MRLFPPQSGQSSSHAAICQVFGTSKIRAAGGVRDVVAQVPADAIFLVRCYGCMPGGGIFKHSRPENGHNSSHAAICQVLGTSKIRAAGGARGVVAQAPADAIFLVRCYGSPLNRLHLPPA